MGHYTSMQQFRSEINYRYEELARGGRAAITAQRPEAVSAVHESVSWN